MSNNGPANEAKGEGLQNDRFHTENDGFHTENDEFLTTNHLRRTGGDDDVHGRRHLLGINRHF